jgi:hypothetical protein
MARERRRCSPHDEEDDGPRRQLQPDRKGDATAVSEVWVDIEDLRVTSARLRDRS